MSRQLTLPALAALLSLPAFAQTTAATTPPAFEAADVHVNTRVGPHGLRAVKLSANRYAVRDATMVDLITLAYATDPNRVLGGPTWLELDRFDLLAKVPPATSPEALSLMLRTLLADRFHLALHTDFKPLPAFVLTVGKGGARLKPAADSTGPSGCDDTTPRTPMPTPGSTVLISPYVSASCHNMTAEDIAGYLHRRGGPYLKDPVVNSTGLKGSWDFDIKYSAYYLQGMSGSTTITLSDAVDRQLGLKLEAGTAPLPVIVIDSVDRKPTANPPGTADQFTDPPAEFEVAVIKPSKPDVMYSGIQPAGSQLNIRAITLHQLISSAWDLDFERIADAPKWLDTDKFDILAKLPAAPGGRAIEYEDLAPMFRSLLADRFKLKTHMEDRLGDQWVLSAANPRLKKANPVSRSFCLQGPGPDGNDPRNPARSRLLTCQNVTMAEFAEQILNFETEYVGDSAVLDATGLTGAYDFTVSYSTPQAIWTAQHAPAPSGDAAPSDTASEPSGTISFSDALNLQLGLKLEKQKRSVPMLVIDHVEPTPTEN